MNDLSLPEGAGEAALQSLDTARHAVISLQSELARVRDELARTTVQSHQFQTERDAMQGVLRQAEIERDLVRGDCERWRSDCEQRAAALAAVTAQMARQSERERGLHSELLEVYRDLHAEDLPTLLARIGMNLTGSEAALFTGPQGEGTVSAIGLDDMPDFVAQALYEFTKRAAREEDSIECNDPSALPDGSSLVNIACAPVVVRGNLTGVLLVANKRSGPYTDDDMEILLSIGRHAGVALENQRLHCALGESFRSTIAVLADAIEAKDPYTRGHCESVSRIAVEVARRLGIKDSALEEMQYAALLHDVGKIGIPDGILLKPGKLLPEEYLIIQKHSAIGSDIIKRVPSLQAIAPIVLHHHERLDGSGYPNGQSGVEISLSSRIIGAVDAFDAMTSVRPYREPWTPDVALLELQRCSGSQFDPDVVAVLEQVVKSETTAAAMAA